MIDIFILKMFFGTVSGQTKLYITIFQDILECFCNDEWRRLFKRTSRETINTFNVKKKSK